MICCRLILGVAVAALCAMACADVTLDPIYTDGMVIQRERPVMVKGLADVGEQVTISIAEESATATAGDDGIWLAKLPAQPVTRDLTLSVRGTTRTIELKNIAVGDVWICGGQSNMDTAIKVYQTAYPDVITTASYAVNNPDLRLYFVGQKPSDTPEKLSPTPPKFFAKWQPSTQESNYLFSAVGYYFGKNLQPQIDVPVGLIYCAVGSSLIRTWLPRENMEESAEFRHYLQDENNEKLPSCKRASKYYNGMIAPLHTFPVKGVVWYQGESDVLIDDSFFREQYGKALYGLIASWRAKWYHPLPFVVVVVAGFHAYQSAGDDQRLAVLREHQLNTQMNIVNVATANAMDLGKFLDVHPPYKEVLGERLCSATLNRIYGLKNIVGTGPTLEKSEVSGDAKSIELTFGNVGHGMIAPAKNFDGQQTPEGILTGFEVCGADGKYVAASAVFTGTNRVRVECPDGVVGIKGVRYAWADFPVCNLYNVDGFPAMPFRRTVE